jgi:hypothetical protein
VICDAYPVNGVYIPFGICEYAIKWWVELFFGWLR